MSKLRDFRKHSEQTATELAAKLGISQAYLSEIETGKKTPSVELAYDIAVKTGGVVPMSYWAEQKKNSKVNEDSSSHIANKKSTERGAVDEGHA